MEEHCLTNSYVGLSEEEAKKKFKKIDIYRSSFRPLKYSLSKTKEKVFIKLVVNKETDKVLGLHYVGDALALVIVLFGLVRAIIGSGSETDLQTTTTVAAEPAIPASTSEFTIVARGGSSFVAARQVDDRKVIYQGTLADGESATVKKSGAVEIVLTQPDAIVIKNGNEDIRATGSGVGGSSKIRIP